MAEEGKKTMSEWGKKILSIFDKGVSASKKGIQSAGSAISDFGDKSVLRIEKSQLQNKADKAYAELGKLVFAKLSSSRSAFVTASDEGVSDVITTIKSLLSNITKHEEAINEGKASEEKADTKKPAAKAKTASSSTKAKATTAKKSATKKTATKKTASAKASAKPVAKKATKTAATKTATTKTTTKKTTAKAGAKKSAAKK